jgi:hypothetical protein
VQCSPVCRHCATGRQTITTRKMNEAVTRFQGDPRHAYHCAKHGESRRASERARERWHQRSRLQTRQHDQRPLQERRRPRAEFSRTTERVSGATREAERLRSINLHIARATNTYTSATTVSTRKEINRQANLHGKIAVQLLGDAICQRLYTARKQRSTRSGERVNGNHRVRRATNGTKGAQSNRFGPVSCVQ